MPHIDIQCFPRQLSDEVKQALADDITAAIVRHLGSKESSVSVALNEVDPDSWKTRVWDTEIAPQIETLIKKPGYDM